ncbi:hypothetical protein OSC27_07145 [Microbacterium sp. STN6]|uniref:hypothetical protein n=1 Tax=Microbacterium sp. STN6 TaxID=2995588 RepID=UPI002260FD43|nr:hypothetical protein [Microbacterium sp. STN6]MCX7522052.1 hypothetical protein [Microbacterium sp. STN6]
MSVDRFGIPDNFFGAHDEDLFGALGRIASLSALVEYQALTIYQTMMNLRQNAATQRSAGQLIGQAREALASVGSEATKAPLVQYFTDVDAVLRQRNDYIHSLWPAQPGGQLFGWRPSRNKIALAHEPNQTLTSSLAELRAFIITLVELIQRRDAVYGAARAEQQLKINAEVTS